MHTCPMVNPGPVPHVGGPILPPCKVNVLTGKLPQARITDRAVCVGPPDMIAKGSATVLVGSLPAARLGDNTVHGGVIVAGCPTVLIGDAGGGGGAGGGGAGAMAAAAALSEPMLQAQALIAAAKAGIPFVERCSKAGAPALTPSGPKKYGKAIVIEGDDDFKKRVTADLDAINKTPTGAKLLADLDASGKTVKITKTSGGNSVSYSDVTKATKQANGKNGLGSDSTVKYNPDRNKIGTEPWETRPPAIGLAHELIHAKHASEGSRDVTQVPNDKKGTTTKLEEVRTTGVPPYDKEPYSENKIRSEWNPKQPERKWY
jgi:uncharacterized Zn-binding protein involved in type VI secretion